MSADIENETFVLAQPSRHAGADVLLLPFLQEAYSDLEAAGQRAFQQRFAEPVKIRDYVRLVHAAQCSPTTPTLNEW